MLAARSYAALSPTSPLTPHALQRRDPGPTDVVIGIRYCGICHSDLHYVRGDWGKVPYPAVPGHEIVGTVLTVGSGVSRFAKGDSVGVGCMVDSCQRCASCGEGLEQFCENGFTGTYGGVEKQTGRPTAGGYADTIVVDEKFVLRIPAALDPAGAAPLLCAGITTYSPLRHWKVGPGTRVGVVGLGGLGHMALKLARAMGAEVTLFTTSPGKEADAARLGAHRVVISKDPQAMAAMAGQLDYIINTVAASHDLDPFIAALKRDGTMTLLGAPSSPHPSPGIMALLSRRRSLAGSMIGGIAETQEMLDFCAEHGITADVEVIPVQEVNTAYDRMLKSDVRYRFVIDMASLAGG
jgi:uncharacterized zinc-type alcohol dehydrogenase-like protein